ncbi:hypothetical protein DOE63_20820 [Salmonella enterica subsp. diarizonae serovar 59:z10:-]|nr:hypothetical protein DOE63_20820 [Salmonella enterica subsp. diarizonae serovar 59:z10:-]
MASLANIHGKPEVTFRCPQSKKLTPPEELKQMKARFISFHEVCERITGAYPDMTHEEVREWILGKIVGKTSFVRHSMAGYTRPVIGGEISKASSGDEKWSRLYGFVRSELEAALDMDLSAPLPVCHQDDVYVGVACNGEPEGAKPSPADIAGDSQLLANDENSIEWDMSVAGMNTALNVISGLATALGKTSEAYRRGGKLNISGLANCAERNLKQFGGGFSVSDRSVRKLLTDALKQCLPEIENEADQNEKPH